MNMCSLRDSENLQLDPTDLNATILRDREQIEELRQEWNKLLDETSYPTVYSTYDFCLSGWKHFHEDDSSPYVVCLRHHGKLVAVFPLRQETSYVYTIEYELLLPMHTTEADKPYPLIADGYEQNSWMAFADYLKSNATDWDILYWPEIPDVLEGVEELELAFADQRPFSVESKDDAFGPILDLDQTWDEFKSKHRKLRKAITRINNKLEGGVFLKVYRSPEEIAKAVDVYADIENKGWKAGKIGVARNDTSRDFYRDLSITLAKNDQIRIGVLYHGTIPISAEIAYTSGDRVFFSHGTYDPAYKDVSPGKISTGLFIKEFLDDKFDYGDFLAGFAHYLSPWSDDFMTTTEVYIYNRRPAVYAIWKWRKTKDWLKEKYKNNPELKAKAERAYVRVAKILGIDVDKADA
ncbi:MAG: GNAT family N-acetyltransferase [Granulosicoccaceae bacterium]